MYGYGNRKIGRGFEIFGDGGGASSHEDLATVDKIYNVIGDSLARRGRSPDEILRNIVD